MAEIIKAVDHPLMIKYDHWLEMRADVEQKNPAEACGLLAGSLNLSGDFFTEQVHPISNIYSSPVRFRMDPAEQLNAFIQMESSGWDLVAIYHSHPAGPDHPSETDMNEAFYPDVTQILWYLKVKIWQCKVFLVQRQRFLELPCIVTTE